MVSAPYQGWTGGPDLRQQPDFLGASAAAVRFVPLASTVPFPGGYLLSLAVRWPVAMYLELPWLRAGALFLILATLAFLSRPAILGALEVF